MEGGTRSRNKVSKEAEAIVSGPTLEHKRKKPKKKAPPPRDPSPPPSPPPRRRPPRATGVKRARRRKVPRTGTADKTDPYTGETVTRAEYRKRIKARQEQNKHAFKVIKRNLRGFSKTAVRKSVSRLKKMFKGVPGHWKSKKPLNNLARTYNKISTGCDLLEGQDTAKFLLPPQYRDQYPTE